MIQSTQRNAKQRPIAILLSGLLAILLTLTSCSTEKPGQGNNNNDKPASSGASRNFGADQSYDLPPKGNFHTLTGVTGSIPTNLGYLNDLIMLPGAIYNWQNQDYYYLLADDSSTLSDDGLTFDYKVRSGLKWSDGSALTAKDVYGTFMLRYSMQLPLYKYLEKVEMTDDETIQFTLNKPAPIAIYWILRERPASMAQYGDLVDQAEKAFNEKTAADSESVKQLSSSISTISIDDPLVSGPFQINRKNMTNSQLQLTKNEHGYKADKINYDTITVHSGSTETITPLVLSGDIHYATDGFPIATTKQFEQQGYDVRRPPTYVGPALYFNYNKLPEFSDVRVRQAFAYFLNRDQMGTLSLGESGKGVKQLAGISDTLVEQWVDADNQKKLTDYALDPAKAESLLNDAGWKKQGGKWLKPDGSPAKYDLTFPGDYVDWAAVGQSLAEQANAFGIQVTPIGADSSQQEVDVQSGNFQLAIQAWGASNPFPTDSYIAAMFTFNEPQLGEGKGMGFDLNVETNALGRVDLKQEIENSAFGSEDELVQKTSRLAIAFNELLPIVPLVERYANTPVVTTKVEGVPQTSEWDQNSIYSDNPMTVFFYEGMLKPKG